MLRLLDVQRGFRNAVLRGDGAAAPAEIVGGRVSAAARLAIYRNNVFGNLTKALRLSYPAVERLVGEDFFTAAAERFIVAGLPGVADLYQYGAGFAEFLASFEAAASLPYLPDVARLEWAVNRALHAAPAGSLSPERLDNVPAEQRAELRLRAHPTLSLLSLGYPARAIWQAVLIAGDSERDGRLAAIDPGSGGEAIAVLRSDGGFDVTVLSDTAFAFAQALTGGCPLGQALETAATDEAARLLADFLTRGFFADMDLPKEHARLLQGTPA